MHAAAKVALQALVGGAPRRPRSELLLKVESPYLSDDGSQSPKKLSEQGDLVSPGVPSGVVGVPPDAKLVGEGEETAFGDGRGYPKPVCRRPAPVGGYPGPAILTTHAEECGRPTPAGNGPGPLSNVVAEAVRLAVIEEGLGCCKTTLRERREKQKWYKRNRKRELLNRKKQRRTVRPETRERPGGKTHEKRKVYRPRNYPDSIQQPARLDDPHEVKVTVPVKPRQYKVHWREVEPARNVRRIDTKRLACRVAMLALSL
jgi:hypothetical protein